MWKSAVRLHRAPISHNVSVRVRFVCDCLSHMQDNLQVRWGIHCTISLYPVAVGRCASLEFAKAETVPALRHWF